MAYEGGYTSALDSAARRDNAAAYVQQVADALRAQQFREQEFKRAQAQQQRNQAIGGQALRALAAQMQTAAPAPQQPQAPTGVPNAMMGGGTGAMFGPQPPAPGVGSVPMMVPKQPMGAPPGAMGSPSADTGALETPGAAEMAAPPPPMPWVTSPAAPESLGGQPPVPPGAQPSPPAAGGMPTEPPLLPPNMLSVPNIIQQLSKMNIPDAQIIPAVQEMMPLINAQNKQALEDYRMQHEARMAAQHAYQAVLNERRLGVTETNASTAATRAKTAADKATAAPAAEAETLTPEGMAVAAELIKAGRSLPGGWSRAGQSRGNAILNAMGSTQEGGAGSGSISGAMASYNADKGSLAFQQKRVDAIEGSMKKIDKDAVTLMSVLDKGAFSEARIANVPINKLRRQMSDPDLAKLDLAAQLLGVEYERMMTGGLMSVAQLHEGAREDAKNLISGDMAPKEIRAKWPVMQQEMQNARNAANEQLAEIKGRLSTKSGAAPTGTAAPKPAAAPSGGSKPIPQVAIDDLKAHPGDAKLFDEAFGPGSAARILGK